MLFRNSTVLHNDFGVWLGSQISFKQDTVGLNEVFLLEFVGVAASLLEAFYLALLYPLFLRLPSPLHFSDLF